MKIRNQPRSPQEPNLLNVLLLSHVTLEYKILRLAINAQYEWNASEIIRNSYKFWTQCNEINDEMHTKSTDTTWKKNDVLDFPTQNYNRLLSVSIMPANFPWLLQIKLAGHHSDPQDNPRKLPPKSGFSQAECPSDSKTSQKHKENKNTDRIMCNPSTSTKQYGPHSFRAAEPTTWRTPYWWTFRTFTVVTTE